MLLYCGIFLGEEADLACGITCDDAVKSLNESQVTKLSAKSSYHVNCMLPGSNKSTVCSGGIGSGVVVVQSPC